MPEQLTIPSVDGQAEAEEWRDIPGYEGYYQVSSLGRVRGLDRIVNRSDGGTERRRGMILKQKIIKGRSRLPYRQVQLQKDGTAWYAPVHQLVLLAFVGPLPEGMQTRHLDNDPGNNKLGNLAYGTSTENQHDRIANGTSNIGEGHPNAIVTEEQVREIRRLAASKTMTQAEIAKMFGLKKSGIESIVYRVTWKHVI